VTPRHDPAARQRTSELLAGIAAAPGEDGVPLGEIVDTFGVRGFGILIVLGTLTAFIPTPVGAGAVAGPLVMLFGAQMLFGMRKPWLPRWLRARRVSRAAIGRFVERMRKVLLWLERASRPRWTALFAGIWPSVTGLLVIGHGLVLALPIPLTNYPLALVLMLAGTALVEDDGIALLVAWALMAATIVTFLLLSGTLVEWAGHLFGA
jgi:hypothetical protein